MNTSHLLLFLPLLFILRLSSALQIGERCNPSGGNSCDTGLVCGTCGFCSKIKPTDPKSKENGLVFNKYSWLTTHNSYAKEGGSLLGPANQIDSIGAQLNNGVRGLMLDMYDFDGNIWLCHSAGTCYNFTAFEPAEDALTTIQKFLEVNPTEIITIFIEDYVQSTDGLTKVFNAAGLKDYMFPLASMPKNGEDWPLISDMITKNQRLIVFTSKRAKEASEGIAYVWNYVVENQYGNDKSDGGMVAGECPNRAESSPMNDTKKSLVLMNYFPTNPNATESCLDNSTPLTNMLDTCHKLSGNRWANFIAVDFYKNGDGYGTAFATNVANGELVCGCKNIDYCKVNGTFGSCNLPPPSPPRAQSIPLSPPLSTTDDNGSDMTGKSSDMLLLVFIQGVLMLVLLL